MVEITASGRTITKGIVVLSVNSCYVKHFEREGRLMNNIEQCQDLSCTDKVFVTIKINLDIVGNILLHICLELQKILNMYKKQQNNANANLRFCQI